MGEIDVASLAIEYWHIILATVILIIITTDFLVRFVGQSSELSRDTNRRFNRTARKQANILNVKLFEGEQLAKMRARYPIRRAELERILLSIFNA